VGYILQGYRKEMNIDLPIGVNKLYGALWLLADVIILAPILILHYVFVTCFTKGKEMKLFCMIGLHSFGEWVPQFANGMAPAKGWYQHRKCKHCDRTQLRYNKP
jgi:hypothetical protein